jgi:hypothetical protein
MNIKNIEGRDIVAGILAIGAIVAIIVGQAPTAFELGFFALVIEFIG